MPHLPISASHPSTVAMLVLAAGVGALPLGAQAPPPDTVIQIPPVVVEVLRSPLAGARTPFAVAGVDLGADASGPRDAAFLADRLRALPGLQIQNRHNLAVGERLAVRGFGARAQFGVRGLRVVVDGIPATLPDGQSTLDHLDLASLGRAELLRGPGSSLYGNGAGGVLLLQSRRPEAGSGSVFGARVAGGSDGLAEGTFSFEHAAPGGVSTLASLSRLAYDGYRADPVDGGQYGRGDRWTVNARHLRRWLGGELALTVAGVDLDAENPGSLPLDSLGDPDRSAWGFNVRQRTGKTVEQFQAGAIWRGPLANTEAELASWLIGRDVRNPIPSDIIGLDRRAWGARTGLEGQAGPLRWGGGVDLEFMSDARTNHSNDGGTEGDLGLEQDESVRAMGLHVRMAGDLGPLSVHGALRHDRIRFEADDLFLADGADDSGSRTLTGWSPSLGALLPLSPSIDIFASVSSLLETPTTTEFANRPTGAGGFNPEIDPTTGRSWEAGLRGRAAGRLGWELVAFRTDLEGELVPFEVPESPGRTFFRNAGESRHEGFEASIRASLPGGITTRAAFTRVDARFRTPAGDAEAGNLLPGRAPNRFEAVASLAHGPWNLAADLQWNDAVPANDANTAEAPSHTLVGARASFDIQPRVGGLRATPFVAVHNLFDENHVASVVPNAFGARYFEPGPGRQLRAGVSVTF